MVYSAVLGDDGVIIMIMISTLHPFQYRCTVDQEVSYHLHNHGWYYPHHHHCSYDDQDLMLMAAHCLHFYTQSKEKRCNNIKTYEIANQKCRQKYLTKVTIIAR